LEFFDVGSFCEGQFILQLNLWDKVLKKKWNLLNVYEAAHDENRREFLSELARYCNQNHDPFMVGGDFNLVRFSSKKTKATSTDIPLFSMLSLTVKNCLISKWWGANIPGQIIRPPTLERLDRCLVSKEWESLFVAKMASHAIFQYNVLALDDTHNT